MRVQNAALNGPSWRPCAGAWPDHAGWALSYLFRLGLSAAVSWLVAARLLNAYARRMGGMGICRSGTSSGPYSA